MKGVIHIREVVREMERKDESGKRPSFSLKTFKKDGSLAVFENAVCSSSYHKGTLNIYCPASAQTRTVKTIFITEFNGKEVVL